MSPTIVVTGFAPFGGETLNASMEAVRLLPDQIGDFVLVKSELPVEYGRMKSAVEHLIAKHAPAAILSVGQAAGRMAVTPELIAVNLLDSASPDNSGRIIRRHRIDPLGADGLFSTVPIFDMVVNLKKSGIPAELSMSAGSYVCNCLMYHLLCQTKERGIPAGFVHLPALPALTDGRPGVFSMDSDQAAEALVICLKTISIFLHNSTGNVIESTLQN